MHQFIQALGLNNYKQPACVQQISIAESDQRGTLGEGYLGVICNKKVPVKLKNTLYKMSTDPL